MPRLLRLCVALVLLVAASAPALARPTAQVEALTQGAIHPPVETEAGLWYRSAMGLVPYYGQSVRVALLDTGTDCGLPALGGSVGPGQTFSAATNTNPCYDGFGHGTHTAGLIHQACPSCHITIYKIMDDNGRGVEADLANAIRQAVLDHNQIISMSVGGYRWDDNAAQAIQWARANGVLLFASSGNDSAADPYGGILPASYAGVQRIAACGPDGHAASFSDWAPNVWMCFPGVNVSSTFPRYHVALDDDLGISGISTTVVLSGTSMAAPLAAGEAGTLLAAGVDPQTALRVMETTATGPAHSDRWHVGYGDGHEARALEYVWMHHLGGRYTRPEMLGGQTPPVEPPAPPAQVWSWGAGQTNGRILS